MKDTIILNGQPCLWIFGSPYALGRIPSLQENFLYIENEMYTASFHFLSKKNTLSLIFLIGFLFLLILTCPYSEAFQ